MSSPHMEHKYNRVYLSNLALELGSTFRGSKLSCQELHLSSPTLCDGMQSYLYIISFSIQVHIIYCSSFEGPACNLPFASTCQAFLMSSRNPPSTAVSIGMFAKACCCDSGKVLKRKVDV
ncbi:uncharacterized protein BDR25DRAFT_83014 [Lindgomyces ingoldianus]|uniref:Uncharacterized protein n=1 Tax=Lindgomyces ingoldianus TaxID=673940 RepID=A0ACB6QFW8_9PLEO|nr:uncharacterized protein BDR25DRAFT_83014 [Lindgomyces ingoldianus]KAF2465791.1 hypothetical protein BDR25DRAFT_83014 [Lindgomyces ingoldianus]